MEVRVVTCGDILGQLARFAVEQHPYNEPPRLGVAIATVRQHAERDFAGIGDSLRFFRFRSRSGVEQWLRKALSDCEALTEWNTPRSGHERPMLFVSLYHRPSREDDIVDIDALFRNVAFAAWRNAAEFSACLPQVHLKAAPLGAK